MATIQIKRGLVAGLPSAGAGEPLFTTDQFRLYVGSSGNRLVGLFDKIDGTTAPTVNDDAGDGFSVGSEWCDTTADKVYICIDSTIGSAIWKEVGAASSGQPLDATLTALAALTIAANSLTIGTGADAFSQVTFAANTFPARASTGNLVAKIITDFGLDLVGSPAATDARTTLGLGTAAVEATGASLHTIPFLDGVNTWSASQQVTRDMGATTTGTFSTLSTTVKSTAPAAGFGEAISHTLSSTVSPREAAREETVWVDATDASRKAQRLFTIYDTAAREYLRGEASGTAPKIGVLGAAASARLASPDVGTALVTFGFASGTPTFAGANVTGTVPNATVAATVPADAITNAMLADVPTATFKGRTTAATGNPEDLTIAQARAMLGVVSRGYIDGLLVTFNSTTSYQVGAGVVRDSTDTFTIILAATSKVLQSSGAWSAGNGGNGLDTGARAASTWYHIWAICKADGTSPDFLYSLSATAPTMPATYTLKAGPIASFKTDSGALIFDQFQQTGNKFVLKTPTADIDATNPGTAAVTRTMNTPLGIRVEGIFNVGFAASAVSSMPSGVLISDLSTADVAPTSTLNSGVIYSGTAIINNAMFITSVFTNTSSQIRSRLQISAAATHLIIATYGWIHPRGQNL